MKIVSELTYSDFITNPVWTWDEDDSNAVIPLIGEIKPDNHNAIFVSSQFFLGDGSNAQGFVAIRMSDQKVYSIALADKRGDLFDLPLNPLFRDTIDLDQFAKKISKDISDIFPLNYSTISLSFWGGKLEGRIDGFE